MVEESQNIIVTKASGNTAVFSPERLKKSLHKSGAGRDSIEFILKQIQPQLYNGIHTKKIYRLAFSLLKKISKESASKYKLKNAIFELGPSGYPFENFVAEILKHQGFKVKVGQVIEGNCVNHEVDVVAEKDDKHFMIECKFHHSNGIFCDVKIPLYIKSRFNDIDERWKKIDGNAMKFHEGWVVTNTRFSMDALQYGTCTGLNLLSWDYPKKNALKDLIDKFKLYPITCLHSISVAEKQKLLEKKVVLSKNLINQLLVEIGIGEGRINGIIAEAKKLCQEEL